MNITMTLEEYNELLSKDDNKELLKYKDLYSKALRDFTITESKLETVTRDYSLESMCNDHKDNQINTLNKTICDLKTDIEEFELESKSALGKENKYKIIIAILFGILLLQLILTYL